MGLRIRLLLVFCAALAVCVGIPTAQASLLFQTTFNCPKEWNQTAPNSLNEAAVCAPNDLMTYWGGWTTSAGNGDRIITAANNPLGKGMGFRHWRGPGGGNNGGGIRLDLPTKPLEVWVRWYMRYQQGFAWATQQQTKELYFNAGGQPGNSFTLGFHDGGTTFGVATAYPRSQNLFGPPGWNSIMGGPTGDGKWHLYETHINARTGQTVAESWIDGKRTHRHTIDPYTNTPVDFANSGVLYILVGSNASTAPTTQPDMYVDYDDFAISTTGYIGPISGTPIAPPDPVTNVRF